MDLFHGVFNLKNTSRGWKFNCAERCERKLERQKSEVGRTILIKVLDCKD